MSARAKPLKGSGSPLQADVAHRTPAGVMQAMHAQALLDGQKTQTLAPGVPAAVAQPPANQSAVAPFLNPQDEIAAGQFQFGQTMSKADLMKALGDLAANTSYSQSQNDRNALQGSTAATDAFAGRGIEHSSIRDGALADIEAQRSISNNFLTDALNRAQIDTQTRLGALGAAASAYQIGSNDQAVSNAQAINDTILPADGVASAPTSDTPAASAAPAGPAKGAGPPLQSDSAKLTPANPWDAVRASQSMVPKNAVPTSHGTYVVDATHVPSLAPGWKLEQDALGKPVRIIQPGQV